MAAIGEAAARWVEGVEHLIITSLADLFVGKGSAVAFCNDAGALRCAGRQPPGGLLRHALHHGRIKDWFDHTLELDENLAPISATVTVTKKVLGCFDEPRVAFQLSYTQGTQGMPRVERLES